MPRVFVVQFSCVALGGLGGFMSPRRRCRWFVVSVSSFSHFSLFCCCFCRVSDALPPVVHGGFFRLFGRSVFEAVFSLAVVSLCGCFRGSLLCFVSVHGGLLLLLLDGVFLF